MTFLRLLINGLGDEAKVPLKGLPGFPGTVFTALLFPGSRSTARPLSQTQGMGGCCLQGVGGNVTSAEY